MNYAAPIDAPLTGFVGNGGGVLAVGALIVSLIRVTAPLRASARLSSVTPESTEIDVRARIVPANTESSGARLRLRS